MKDDINIFIPSYHRPDNIKTAKYFVKKGWQPDKIHVFIDSEADDKDEYDFSCAKLNTFQDFAKLNGIDFYCVIDDDTQHYQVRAPGLYRMAEGDDIRGVFQYVEEFMRRQHIGLFGLPQTGDMIGGCRPRLYIPKVMNTTFYLMPYVYRGERGVQDDDTSLFTGVMNEGYFTGSCGVGLTLKQTDSAKQEGGLTDLYRECKLLNKSLVTPIQFPSAIYAEKQKNNGGRLHHHICQKYLFPRVLKVGKDDRSNIAWDTYPEDVPFTNEPKRQ